MVDSLREFNPLGQFVAGKQAKLGLQQQESRNALADIGLERAKQGHLTSGRQTGIQQERERLLFLNRAGKALLSVDPSQRGAALQRIGPLAERVGIPAGTFTADQLTDENIQGLVNTTEEFINNPQSLERDKLSLRERELKQRKELAFAKPGLAGQTKKEQIEAEKGRKAEVAGEVEAAKEQAKLSAKIVSSGFSSMAKINKNILNLDRALDALGKGAGVGAAEKFFPSIKAASVELDQIRNELGLDVIGAVTFGALSQGELSLALQTALPTGLDTAELTDFLQRKKAAQEKLLDYYGDQIRFLSSPGATVAQFLDRKQQEAAPEAPPPQGADSQAAQGVQFLGFE